MKKYSEIFENEISYYQQDFARVQSLLTRGEHVVLASSLATGEERFLDYVAQRLSRDKAYSIMVLSNSFLKIEEVVNFVQMSKTKAVIVFPYFGSDVSYNAAILKELYRNFQNGEFVAVIKLPWTFHQNSLEFRAIAPFLTNVIIRQPLTLAQTAENIATRQELHGWQAENVKADEVYSLSGGLIRVIKRILKYYDLNKSLEPKELLAYPALVVVLAELAEMYAGLSRSKLHELGIVDAKGKVISELLRTYLSTQNIAPKQAFPPKMRQLFNLFYANRHKLVTEQMLDQIVRKGKSGSLWANYKLVARMRKLLGTEFTIRTVKGKGYILSEKA